MDGYINLSICLCTECVCVKGGGEEADWCYECGWVCSLGFYSLHSPSKQCSGSVGSVSKAKLDAESGSVSNYTDPDFKKHWKLIFINLFNWLFIEKLIVN